MVGGRREHIKWFRKELEKEFELKHEVLGEGPGEVKEINFLGRTITLNDVHFFTADTLGRLERYDEAEAEFLTELRLFPNNGRAHANLAMLYRSQSRDDEVERTIDDLLAAMPSPEGYGLAAQLWTIFGEASRADAVRAEARERFPEAR